MKTNAETIDGALVELSECYQGQFRVTENTHKVWLRHLRDCDAETVLAAVDAICNESGRYPPSPGVVRDRARQLASGALSAKTGADAWDRVMKYYRAPVPEEMTGTELAKQMLTPNERKALKSIGGSWEIGHTKNGDFLRSQFIKRFDELEAAARAETNATPETKALVESRQGATDFVKQLTDKMGE